MIEDSVVRKLRQHEAAMKEYERLVALSTQITNQRDAALEDVLKLKQQIISSTNNEKGRTVVKLTRDSVVIINHNMGTIEHCPLINQGDAK